MPTRLAVRADRAFDGVRVLPDGALVLVDKGRIVAVEPATAAVPDGWRLVDSPGGTLLPGLIDAHTHLCCDSRDGALDRVAEHGDGVIETALRRQLAAGVTAVRDLGDHRYATLAWRSRPGLPAVTVSGPPITSPRGHCWNMGGEVSGTEQLRAAVAERVDRGVDVVKVMAGGGVNTQGSDVHACQFGDADLRLIVTLAHDAGLPVTAHAHALAAVEQAVAAGVDGVEHCTCLTPEGVRIPGALLDRLAEAAIAVCPTIGVLPGFVPPPRVREQLERHGLTAEIRAGHAATMYHAGVRLVSGADSGINAGKAHGVLPHSVVALVTAGVPVAAALASATSVAAQVCGSGAHRGRVSPGFAADLLVVDGDLGVDPRALTRPASVVLGGDVVTGT